MTRNRLFALLAPLLALCVAAPSFAASSDSDVIIVNKSSWSIHELYFSPVDDDEWGDDQLGAQTIEPGEKFTLSGVPCDSWDVRVVDEEGDACVVEDVALCADTDKWVINDSDLLACQSASE